MKQIVFVLNYYVSIYEFERKVFELFNIGYTNNNLGLWKSMEYNGGTVTMAIIIIILIISFTIRYF